MKDLLFVGSFDPFTIGHKSIVDRALEIFDCTIFIGIAVNSSKKSMFTVDSRVKAISELYKDNKRVNVILSTDMTYETAQAFNLNILRGVRNAIDFEYERNLEHFNREQGVETVFLFDTTNNQFTSSSLAREVMGKRELWKKYVPDKIRENLIRV